MKKLVWLLIILLILLHHDFWFWDDTTLILGFLPVGMVYHIGISLAAAGTWFLATLIAWPRNDAEPKNGEA